jgi:plasmid replication initiation protein
MIPTPENIAKMKKEKLADSKRNIHPKVSNTFIESAIQNNNASAIKTIYYLASHLEGLQELKDKSPTTLISMKFDTREMLKYTEMKLPEVKRNLKAMQQTSITFINEEKGTETGINLLPYYEFVYGKHTIEIKLFVKIAHLIIDVKRNYSQINTKALMKLKSKHTLKMFPLLQRIEQYSEEVGKRKTMSLGELNMFFGVNYKKLSQLELHILKPVKEELDSHSKVSFIHETNYDYFDVGRPKAISITIDLIGNVPRLF